MTNKIDKKLEKILKRHLKIKSLSDLKKIKKLKFGDELDSLNLISIISDMAKDMKINITVNQIAKIKNIQDIIALSKKMIEDTLIKNAKKNPQIRLQLFVEQKE